MLCGMSICRETEADTQALLDNLRTHKYQALVLDAPVSEGTHKYTPKQPLACEAHWFCMWLLSLTCRLCAATLSAPWKGLHLEPCP